MIADIRRIYLRDISILRSELDLYPDDKSLWRTIPGLPNTGGNLVLHLTGNLRHFIGAQLGHSGYVRDREAEFSTSSLPRQRLIQEVEAAHDEVFAALGQLDTARLAKPYPLQFDGESRSVGLVLLQMSSHLGYHLGQLNYHRRVVTERAKSAGLSKFSKGLQEIIRSGAISVDTKKKEARIIMPTNAEEMTGDDWIERLRVAGEAREELERLGYEVKG